MEKNEYSFDDFLSAVSPKYKNFAAKAHELLINNGYKIKIELKTSGYFAGYSHPKTKRSVLTFLFRKKGLIVRLYADNHNKYAGLLDSLPDKMIREIDKANICKRLINPDDCNPNCIKEYDFSIKGKNFKKCRYSCFQFEVDSDSIQFLTDLIKCEIKER